MKVSLSTRTSIESFSDLSLKLSQKASAAALEIAEQNKQITDMLVAEQTATRKRLGLTALQ